MADPHPVNRLARETSPYLLQHAHNPVDWYPWGPEAFERAKREEKPIFLSVGYSACHWCHVMERESFENEGIAAVMNELFVNVKVDREERPDVDEIYMKAVQLIARSGGWPMSVWLTPDGRPFYGGTYFPPEDKYGRAGFLRVCKEMARLWKDERERVVTAADGLTQQIRQIGLLAPADEGALPDDLLPQAVADLLHSFDDTHGGFGPAPKFPRSMEISLLLRVDARFGNESARHAALFTLGKMASGGMYDQLGGGFHRYSTDERWLVPHFEKMLYDNALLANTYLDAWLVTGEAEWARVVREILDYVLREMTSPEGLFYATQDADSEGEEGKFFAWDPDEMAAVLGEERAAWVAPFYGVSHDGNFEHGKSVLARPWTIADYAVAKSMAPAVLEPGLAAARAELFAAREKRVKPARDEKVLADWNGLMLSALARAGFHLGEPRYVAAARRAADGVRQRLWKEGRLLRSWKDGQAKHLGNLADHAFLAAGLLDLWEAAFDPRDLSFAQELVDRTIARFWDAKSGGFFNTGDDHEVLISRSKEAYDGATPSGPSVQVMNLLRLAEITGNESLREKAEQTLALYRPLLAQQPQAVARMLAAVDFLQSRPREIVLAVGAPATLAPFLDVLRKGFDPNRVLLVVTPETEAAVAKLSPVVEGKSPAAGATTAYICRDGACRLPITDPVLFAKALATKD